MSCLPHPGQLQAGHKENFNINILKKKNNLKISSAYTGYITLKTKTDIKGQEQSAAPRRSVTSEGLRTAH